MAAKTPTRVKTYPITGTGYVITEAVFTDIDDNDTWASGITSYQSSWFASSVDNSDLVVDATSAGTLTFGSSANNAGTLFVVHMGY
jgi:hypothetical protein